MEKNIDLFIRRRGMIVVLIMPLLITLFGVSPTMVHGGVYDNNNGNWNDRHVEMYNTPEADIMVRIGDIENFGFGWEGGFDPFSGHNTQKHGFPWATPAGEPAGLDRIMVVSGYKGGKAHPEVDGYTVQTQRYRHWNWNKRVWVEHNNVEPISIRYNLGGRPVQSAILQMFVDDFDQNYGPKYQVTFTNLATGESNRIPEMESIINSLRQGGPIGKLITFNIPDNYLHLLRSGGFSIKIDDPTTGAGDGYAVDFVKLLINPGGLSHEATIKGRVIDSKTKMPIRDSIVSANGVEDVLTDEDGRYSIVVPAGNAFITASKEKYHSKTVQRKDIIAGRTYNNVNFELEPIDNTPIVKGQIKDSITKQPIEGAVVRNGNREIITKSDGLYSFEVDVSRINFTFISVTKDGYNYKAVQVMAVM